MLIKHLYNTILNVSHVAACGQNTKNEIDCSQMATVHVSYILN